MIAGMTRQSCSPGSTTCWYPGVQSRERVDLGIGVLERDVYALAPRRRSVPAA